MADYLNECNEQRVAPKDFIEVFCKHCRNPDCVRAEWSSDQFSARISTQEERFFNPHRADPSLPKYARIVEAEFKDLLHRAMQLEVADKLGNWEIPEIPILDGGTDVGTKDQTSEVDEAIKTLAKARGQPGPDLPPVQEGRLVEETPASPPPPAPPQPEVQVQTPAPQPQEGELQHPVIQQADNPEKTAMFVSQSNTPFPKEGAMVDGSRPPPPKPPADPWAAPPKEGKAKKVKAGATIKLDG